MKIPRINHVRINVNDLPAAKAFVLDLGLELRDVLAPAVEHTGVL